MSRNETSLSKYNLRQSARKELDPSYSLRTLRDLCKLCEKKITMKFSRWGREGFAEKSQRRWITKRTKSPRGSQRNVSRRSAAADADKHRFFKPQSIHTKEFRAETPENAEKNYNVRRRVEMSKCGGHSELVEECAKADPHVSTGSTWQRAKSCCDCVSSSAVENALHQKTQEMFRADERRFI